MAKASTSHRTPLTASRSAFGAAIFALLLAAAATPLRAAPWYEHYELAERALDDGAWREAVNELQQALERKGDSQFRARTYGMRVVDYFPYLKLGIAYRHLGQLDAALEAFDTEERLRAIADAPDASASLADQRRQVAMARAEEADAIEQRNQTRVARSLAEAERATEQGRLEDAMNALATGLAIDPGHSASKALMARLSDAMAARDERRIQAETLQRQRATARAHLDAQAWEAAAQLLRQVVAAGPDPEARRWLDEAQEQLAARLAAERRDQADATVIAQALDSAEQSRTDGQLDHALAHLEVVFAIDPKHARALALRDALLGAQRERNHAAQVTATLAEAQGLFDDGRFEQALAAANRALALDPSNPRALGVIGLAYGAINQRLLDQGAPIENLPPAIRFADRRQDLDGTPTEQVENPAFRLTGVVIDSTPITLAVTDDEGTVLDVDITSQAVGGLVISEFSLKHRLTSGPTTFSAVVVDAAGATTRSQYTVLYRRPWFRTPWFPALAGALPALGLGMWMTRRVRRQRRRRQRLERKFNPYIAGGPIFDEKLFFGREPLIQRILQTIPNNSLMLFGSRRIGKTSLLHQVHQRLEQVDDPQVAFFPVFIDLQGTPESVFFASLADPIFEAAEAWVGPTDRAPALERTGYNHHHLARELRGLFDRLRATTEKRVKLVLLIDEVDELNHYDPRINQSLRSLFMRRFAEHLTAVVAGVGIRKAWEKEGSPWYNFFEEMRVDALTPEDAMRLVLEPARGTFDIPIDVARHIVAVTEGKPFEVQRLCLALVQRLHADQRRRITRADVDAASASR